MGEKYKLIQLVGEDGDWVLQSIDHETLYICPGCYGKDKTEIILQRTGARAAAVAVHGFKQYICRNCRVTYSTHPAERYHN